MHHRTQKCIRTLAELYEATNRPEEAAAWQAKLRPVIVPPPDKS